MAQFSDIEKLTPQNYRTWKLSMSNFLITQDLWTIEDCASDFKEGSLREEWEAKDVKALSFISLKVSSSEIIHIKNCKTAREAWQTLADLYRKANPSGQCLLITRLIQFRIAYNDDHTKKMNEYCELREEIMESGLEIPDTFYTMFLLCRLSKDFGSFVNEIQAQDELPTLNELKTKIIKERANMQRKIRNRNRNRNRNWNR